MNNYRKTNTPISVLLQGQLPSFVNADYPLFKRFLEIYYEWLEMGQYQTTSQTTLTPGTGFKELYVEKKLAFQAGDEVKISLVGGTSYMIGLVVEYNSHTGFMSVNVTSKKGTATKSNWAVALNGLVEGRTVYHIMNMEKYRDIDEALDPFIRLFKKEVLPYFPEKTALDITKILRGAREFYEQKGTEDSLKWLFRVIFDQDIEVYYPKKQILIASDGKWKIPIAIRVELTGDNINIDPALLTGRTAIGEKSKARALIEAAYKTVDPILGTIILELYVSNVSGLFKNGENLLITYEDAQDEEQVFTAPILGVVSNVRVDSDIRTDPQQIRRGLKYKVGDPIVFSGGLNTKSVLVSNAIGEVLKVTKGRIESFYNLFPGYGYRPFYKTEVEVMDAPNGNRISSVDVRLNTINTDFSATSSQSTFLEYATVDKMPALYMEDVVISAVNWPVFEGNNRNIILDTGTANTYTPYEYVYANGSSYATANFTGRIITQFPNNSVFLFSVQNTVPLNTSGFLIGQTLYCANSGNAFSVTSVANSQYAINANSQIISALNFETFATGGTDDFQIVDAGDEIDGDPYVEVNSFFQTFWTDKFNFDVAAERPYYRQSRVPIRALGHIAHVYINSAGRNYENGDVINVGDRGYGFTGYVNVNSTGGITRTTITNRGEGYYGPKFTTVTSNNGTGAVLSAYSFGEGSDFGLTTSPLGRILELRLISRGYGYISAPDASLRVMDIVIDNVGPAEDFVQDEFVYQGAALESATFAARVAMYDRYGTAGVRTASTLRLYDYAGTLDINLPFTTEGGTTFTYKPGATIIPPQRYKNRAELPNPFYYGNGKAKAIAEFYNGLIKYNGFFANEDGFVSSDKRLQDGHKYHNYSYVIESDKTLDEYENVIKDIIHPTGNKMFAKTRSIVENDLGIKSNTYIYKKNTVSGVISVSNSYNAVVTGTGTSFESGNVGDILILKSTGGSANVRSAAKVITAVNVSTQTVNVESDFLVIGEGQLFSEYEFVSVPNTTASINITAGFTGIRGNANVISLQNDLNLNDVVRVNNQVRMVVGITNSQFATVNDAWTYTSTNKNMTKLANTTLKLDYNANSADEMISIGDTLIVNIFSTNTYSRLWGTAAVDTSNGIVIGTGTNFSTKLAANDIVMINKQIRSVVNVASATVMNVNAGFSSLETGSMVFRRNDIVHIKVLDLAGNSIFTNVVMAAEQTGLTFKIVPDFTGEHDYEIIKVTD